MGVVDSTVGDLGELELDGVHRMMALLMLAAEVTQTLGFARELHGRLLPTIGSLLQVRTGGRRGWATRQSVGGLAVTVQSLE